MWQSNYSAKEELDNQIDILYERGRANGVDVKIINNEEFNRIVPDGYSSTGRALWSQMPV